MKKPNIRTPLIIIGCIICGAAMIISSFAGGFGIIVFHLISWDFSRHLTIENFVSSIESEGKMSALVYGRKKSVTDAGFINEYISILMASEKSDVASCYGSEQDDISIGVSDGKYSYSATYSLEHKTVFAFKCSERPLFAEPNSSYVLLQTVSGFFSINEADTQFIFNYFD